MEEGEVDDHEGPVGYPPSPPLVVKTSFLARHDSILFKSLSSAFLHKT
jgi:hypothetical protein